MLSVCGEDECELVRANCEVALQIYAAFLNQPQNLLILSEVLEIVAVELTAFGQKLTFDPSAVSPPIINEERFPEPCSLALDISGSCNLRCVYCAENATMPLENRCKLNA